MSPLKIGDKVVLNEKGLRGLYGRVLGYRYMMAVPTTITEVATYSYTQPEQSYIVRVADPEIDTGMLLFDYFFDKETTHV